MRAGKIDKLALAREMRKQPSPGEALLWSRLRGKQVGVKVRRQHIIRGYIADFYCPAAKLVIEVDGQCHAEPERRAYDRRRTYHLAKQGVKVIRFDHRTVMNRPDAVVLAITRAIERRLEISLAERR